MSGSQGLALQRVINVSLNLQPQAVGTRNFGAMLAIGASNVIDTSERIRLYASLDSVAADFGTAAPEYLAADAWFSQKPQPSQLYIGRWAYTATNGSLKSGIFTTSQQTSLLTTLQAVTAGSFEITIDGGAATAVSGLNFSADTNLNGVASTIETALGAAATCTWEASVGRFVIRSATTGATSSVSLATATGSGTDVSATLQLTSATGAASVAGIAAETALAGVQACATALNYGQAWYGCAFAVPGTDLQNTDITDVASYIEAATPSRIFGVNSQDTTILDSTVTTDIASVLQAANYQRTCVQFSSTSEYAIFSLMARAFTVDFTQQNSTITLKFKSEPGITAESLGEAQADALEAKNCNVFVNYATGGTAQVAIIEQGVMCDGTFFDTRQGADWLGNLVQVNMFNVLYLAPTKVPQTDPGVHLLVAAVEAAGDAAVNNGFVAPGVWDSALQFGVLETGMTLAKGYYVYAQPLAQQNASDRGARKAPPIQAAFKLGGAIHSANVALNFNA